MIKEKLYRSFSVLTSQTEFGIVLDFLIMKIASDLPTTEILGEIITAHQYVVNCPSKLINITDIWYKSFI